MNKKLQDSFYRNYPKIFRQRKSSIQESAIPWGIETDDGWYWLLDMLCGQIQNYIDFNKHLRITQVEAVQVKEKFGTLRFYYNGGNERISGMIRLAEYMSAFICETCGSTKNVTQTKSSWICTLCAECIKKRGV